MHEEKLSQTESRRLTAYLREKYQFGIGDALRFWRLTPGQIESQLNNRYGMAVSSGEICAALGRAGSPIA